jgi:predicted RNA-binding Zn ribbon-like protein
VTFAHDTEAALLAAVALVNSAEPPDTLTTTAELDAFFAAHRYTGGLTHDDAELAAVRALRAPLRALLTADCDDAVARTNRILTERQAVPQLVRHDGWDYHLHATDPSAPLADRIAVETAMAMVDIVRADELSRLAVCADKTCDGLVLDLSRNRSRRYCSAACGNRIAVAAYRARKG